MPRMNALTERNARSYESASFLSHAETPSGLALALYPRFSCGVQRKPTRAVEGFWRGGLPLRRLGGFSFLGRGRRFLACSEPVAQRQLPGSYPLSLSSRSKEEPEGRTPMSAKKLSNLRQRSQTVMPRPPYLPHPMFFGLVHRATILAQDLYVGVKDMLCAMCELCTHK